MSDHNPPPRTTCHPSPRHPSGQRKALTSHIWLFHLTLSCVSGAVSSIVFLHHLHAISLRCHRATQSSALPLRSEPEGKISIIMWFVLDDHRTLLLLMKVHPDWTCPHVGGRIFSSSVPTWRWEIGNPSQDVLYLSWVYMRRESCE